MGMVWHGGDAAAAAPSAVGVFPWWWFVLILVLVFAFLQPLSRRFSDHGLIYSFGIMPHFKVTFYRHFGSDIFTF